MASTLPAVPNSTTRSFSFLSQSQMKFTTGFKCRLTHFQMISRDYSVRFRQRRRLLGEEKPQTVIVHVFNTGRYLSTYLQTLSAEDMDTELFIYIKDNNEEVVLHLNECIQFVKGFISSDVFVNRIFICFLMQFATFFEDNEYQRWIETVTKYV